ncbi:Uncharacterised protein [Mycobacteroides abscessus subsp. abscessus]|nr:Uncharacterised protein [Mycobacteroides abscessus subsp. abscessus]
MLTSTRSERGPSDGSMNAHSTAPTSMRTAVPANGARHVHAPSSAPSSGPTARPTPSAASYSRIAPCCPPLAAPTMNASAVAMNSALPSPQSTRIAMRWSMLPANVETPAAMTISARPTVSVRLGP